MPPVPHVPPPCRLLGLQHWRKGWGEDGGVEHRDGGQERLSLLSVWAGRGGDTGEDVLASPLFSQPAFALSLISSVPLFAVGI